MAAIRKVQFHPTLPYSPHFGLCNFCSLSLELILSSSGQTADGLSILNSQITASEKPTLRPCPHPLALSLGSHTPWRLSPSPVLIPQPSSLCCVSWVAAGFSPVVHSRCLTNHEAAKCHSIIHYTKSKFPGTGQTYKSACKIINWFWEETHSCLWWWLLQRKLEWETGTEVVEDRFSL